MSPSSARASHEIVPSQSDDEDLPDGSTFVVRQKAARAADKQPVHTRDHSDLSNQKWKVEKFDGEWYDETTGRQKYLACWCPEELPEEAILEHPGGTKYMRCDGRNWSIDACEFVGVNESGKRMFRVTFEPSWIEARELAKDLDDFWDWVEDWKASQERNSEENPAAHRAIRDDGHMCAETNIDHYSQVQRFSRRYRPAVPGTLKFALLTSRQLRSVTFRASFIGKTVDLKDSRKLNACLVFATGHVQLEICSRCANESGPFAACVVDSRYNNRACTNCAYGSNGPKCSFSTQAHLEIQRRRPYLGISAQESPAAVTPLSATSSRASSPVGQSSVGRQDHDPDITNPTSPAAMSSSPLAARCRSPELGRITSSDELHLRRLSSARVPYPARSPLAPLDDSQLNVASRDDASHTEKEPDAHPNYVPGPSNAPNHQSTQDDPPQENIASSAAKTPRGQKRSFEATLEAPLPPVDISFRHASCKGDVIPCSHPDAGWTAHVPNVGSSNIRGQVYRNKRFKQGEATPDEIRYVISRCPCPYTDYLYGGWEQYVADMIEQGRDNKYSKVTYLSKRFHEDINELISAYCPLNPDSVLNQGTGSAMNPICLDS